MQRSVLLLFVVGSCSGSSQEPTKVPQAPRAAVDAGGDDAGPDTHIPKLSGPPRLLDGRFYVDEGAPHPLACAADKDCIGDTVPDDTGCCVRSQDAHAQTWAWHTWIMDRRLSGGCAKVTCPPVEAPPTLPSVCHMKVRCVERRCADSCSEEPQKEQDQRQEQAPQKQ